MAEPSGYIAAIITPETNVTEPSLVVSPAPLPPPEMPATNPAILESSYPAVHVCVWGVVVPPLGVAVVGALA